MQAVARRADLAPGTVTYHFSDRETFRRPSWSGTYGKQCNLPGPEALPSQQPFETSGWPR